MTTAPVQQLRHPSESDAPAMANTLQELLSEISSRVNLADHRYADIIGEMQDKLAKLDSMAKSARAKADEAERLKAEQDAEAKRKADEEAAEAQRIEAAENARKRVAEAEAAAEAARLAKAVHAAKAAAAAAIESSAARAYPAEVDTFDIIDHTPVRTREPWDTESANVFIRAFEQVETSGMLQPRRSSGFYPEPHVPARHAVAPAEPPSDRIWLEGRFNDIASRISEMMANGSAREIGNRFDHLEDRIDAAMTTVTAQVETGTGTLRQIESHIAEIDEHVDYIRKELTRLDVVEAHIRSLMERKAADEHQDARADMEANGLLQLTGLLQRLVDERKHTEEHTIVMLDTLQQAMIRVLDRMDAIEAGETQPAQLAATPETLDHHPEERANTHGEPAAPPALPPQAIHHHHHETHEHHAAVQQAQPQQQTQPARPAQQQFHAQTPEPQRHDYFEFDDEDAQAHLTHAAQFAAASEPATAPAHPASVGQIRRNFIADTQQRSRPSAEANPPVQSAQSQRSTPAQTRAKLLERLMRPTSRQLAIAALILMIPLNAMFLYLVLGSSKSTAHADVHTSTDVIPLSERIVETSTRNASNESSVAKPLDPLPPESLSRISPPASAEPIAHQTASAEPAAEGGAIELPPASVGPLTLRRAASDGDMSAQFEVAARLAEGKGVDQDFKAAVLWYQRSASRGFAQSQYRLGTHYERGLGVEKDPERARVWYLRAAEQGNVKAMHNLAVLGANRPDGKPDYAEALKWFGEAATYNLPDSQFNLAVLHENGLGLTKDPKTAYVWFSLAARSGDREALKRREAMKAQLSADAVAAADEEVRTFRAKTQVPAVNDPRIAGEQWKRRQVTEN